MSAWPRSAPAPPTPVRSPRRAAGPPPAGGVPAGGAAYGGANSGGGGLGAGTGPRRSRPVLVAGGVTFAAVSAGALHSCGISTAGAAYCWGYNTFGQLGD